MALSLSTNGRLQAKGRAWWRDRGDENLFAPDREGTALGIGADAVFFRTDGQRLRIVFDVEHHASGWAWTARALYDMRVSPTARRPSPP